MTGVIVDRGGLRPAIERLLDDAELRAGLGAAARRHARVAFSWSALTTATREVYEGAR